MTVIEMKTENTWDLCEVCKALVHMEGSACNGIFYAILSGSLAVPMASFILIGSSVGSGKGNALSWNNREISRLTCFYSRIQICIIPV